MISEESLLPRSIQVTSEHYQETTESDLLGSEHVPRFNELGLVDPKEKVYIHLKSSKVMKLFS